MSSLELQWSVVFKTDLPKVLTNEAGMVSVSGRWPLAQVGIAPRSVAGEQKQFIAKLLECEGVPGFIQTRPLKGRHQIVGEADDL